MGVGLLASTANTPQLESNTALPKGLAVVRQIKNVFVNCTAVEHRLVPASSIRNPFPFIVDESPPVNPWKTRLLVKI
jgi:hypothetical protein